MLILGTVYTRVCINTIFHLIEAGSQIQAGGETSFVLIEDGGLMANTIELIAHHPVALWCIPSFVRIAWLAERLYGVRRKSEVLMEAGSLIEAGGLTLLF